MIKKIIQWIKKWFWTKPTSPPPKEKPIKVMGEQVFKEWFVIEYHGQKINLHRNEIPLWNKLNRKDRRAMARKTEIQEKKGLIRFEKIDGRWICLKNKDYGAKTNIR